MSHAGIDPAKGSTQTSLAEEKGGEIQVNLVSLYNKYAFIKGLRGV